MLSNCKKEDAKTDDIPLPVEAVAPSIVAGIRQYSAFNSLGKPSYTLSVSGGNFKKNFKDYKVLFNDVEANAIAGDSLHFVVNIPDAAVAAETKLTIVMDGRSTVYGKPFKVQQLEPVVTSINTEAGMRGSKLVISGNFFSPVISENTVTLNGVKIAADAVSSRSYDGVGIGGTVLNGIYASVDETIYTGTLTITIPANASTGKLSITSYGKTADYLYNFEVISASFTSSPSTTLKSISFDAEGNMYGTVKNKVVKVSPSGAISTLATIGDKDFILGGCVADEAGMVYVASGDDNTLLPSSPYGFPLNRYTENSAKIYKVTPDGQVSILAGSKRGLADGQGADAQFTYPKYIVRNAKTGDLYVSDGLVIRKITASGAVSTLAGGNTGLGIVDKDGQGSAASFLHIYGMQCEAATGNLYVIDDYSKGILRKVTPGGYVSTLSFNFVRLPANRYVSTFSTQYTVGLAIDASSNILVSDNYNVYKIKDGVMSNMYINPFGDGIYGMALNSSNKIILNTEKRLYKIMP